MSTILPFFDSMNMLLLVTFSASILFLIIAFYYVINYRRIAYDHFDVFYIKDDKFIVNSLFKPSYRLNEIMHVELGYTCWSYPNQFAGVMRIIKTNGKKNRYYFFDASVVKKRMTMRTTKEDIFPALEAVKNEIIKAHIPYELVDYQKMFPFSL